MTQTTEIKVSSSTEPFALTNEDKQPAWVTFYNEFAAMQAKISIDELKQNYPACQNILSLLHHLHSDCTAPEQAAVKTLQWLAGVIQNNTPIHTHLAFSDGQGTGKSLFISNILKPIFCVDYKYPEDTDFKERLNLIEIKESNPWINIATAMSDLKIAKGSNAFRNTIIFSTNQYLEKEPANRRVRIARCKTKISTELYNAVLSEIKNGGLMQFADVLHTINGSTDLLPNLNAIY